MKALDVALDVLALDVDVDVDVDVNQSIVPIDSYYYCSVMPMFNVEYCDSQIVVIFLYRTRPSLNSVSASASMVRAKRVRGARRVFLAELVVFSFDDSVA